MSASYGPFQLMEEMSMWFSSILIGDIAWSIWTADNVPNRGDFVVCIFGKLNDIEHYLTFVKWS